jgi:O-antigen/teichoic acid export membrane protein
MEVDGVRPDRGGSSRRLARLLGSAVVAGQAGQLLWLAAGSRTLSRRQFGAVLAAQALYGVLQYVVDNGPALYGARLSAHDGVDDEARGGVVGVRLVLAASAGLIAFSIAAVSGKASIIATAPFVVALLLFAVLNYWESYGRGDGRAWSLYVFLRGAAPAAAACAALALGAALPVWAAGAAECAAVVAVMLTFRTRPLDSVRHALRAPERPWRSVGEVGTSSVLWSVAVSAGTVILNAFGATGAAAAYGVGMRLVTGLTQFAGIVASSIFPSVAGRADSRRLVAIALGAVLAATGAGCLFVAASASLLERLLLASNGGGAQPTLILIVASAPAVGLSVLLTSLSIARGSERALILPYAAGTTIVVVGGFAIAAIDPDSESLWMAGAFVVGEWVCVLCLLRRAATTIDLGRPLLARALAAGVVMSAATTLAAGHSAGLF